MSSDGNTLEQIKIILAKAVDAYHALCTAGKWHVNHHKSSRVSLIICWNCGAEGHRCEACTEPVNKDAIAAAKKKWQASSRFNGGGAGGGKPGGQNSRQKWSRPEQGGQGVKWFSGVPKAYCGKKDGNGSTCGWNCDHSTKFHGKKMENPSSFNLADWSPNHQLVLAQRRADGQPAPPKNPGSGAQANQIMINKDQANDVLTKLERNSTSHETAEIVGALRNLVFKLVGIGRFGCHVPPFLKPRLPRIHQELNQFMVCLFGIFTFVNLVLLAHPIWQSIFIILLFLSSIIIIGNPSPLWTKTPRQRKIRARWKREQKVSEALVGLPSSNTLSSSSW